MKKIIAVLLIAVLCAGSVQAAGKAEGRGGFMGFLAGCCFGIRAGGAYNNGKEIHPLREWLGLVPIVNIVIAVWNGIDGMNGVTTKDLAAQYGANYY